MASGSKVAALDAPPGVTDTEPTDESGWTNTTFDSGTNVCGQTFIAPTSGNVLILWSCRMNADTGGANHRVLCSVKVSTGATIDSGTVVSAASDDSAIESPETAASGTIGQSRIAAGMWRFVSGLTPGQTYNVVVQKKCATTSMTGSIFQRDVSVVGLP